MLKNFRVKKFSWSWLDHENFSTRVKLAMYEYQLQWCVRKWEAAVGEELKCEREKNSAKDPYAVASARMSSSAIYRAKISRISALFLKRQGKISCKVLGRRHYSVDLPQGGLEIPFVNFRCLKNFVC